ncbi:unnamed protein product [Leuciscus chuanchicus]
MLDVLLLFSSICTAVVVGASQTITGYRGERVDIRCSYKSGYESLSKYFCKGKCLLLNKNIMVESGSPAKDERFSLTDDTTARVFTVTITDLRTEDEGQYWCAVEGILPLSLPLPLLDDFSEMLLLVKENNKTTEVSTISSFSVTRESEMNPSSSVTDHQISSTVPHRSVSVLISGSGGNVIVITAASGGLFIIIIIIILSFIIQKKRINRRYAINENDDPSAGSYAALELKSRSSDLYNTLTYVHPRPAVHQSGSSEYENLSLQ